MTDFRALCAELVDSIELLLEMRSPNAGRMSITERRLKVARAALTDEPAVPTVMEIVELSSEIEAAGLGQVDFARAVLTRWGNPAPVPAAEGEVAEVMGLFRRWAEAYPDSVIVDPCWLTRAADPLERQAAPVPAGDSTLRDAARLALTTLHGWSNYDQWVWPISAMAQAKRNTTEAVAALEAALCRPAPAPAEGEVAELEAWLRSTGEGQPCLSDEGYARLTRAADLLEQRHPAPVPVAERLPQSEDCDSEGRVWLYRPQTPILNPYWDLVKLDYIDPVPPTHWLPAHALPRPEVGQ